MSNRLLVKAKDKRALKIQTPRVFVPLLQRRRFRGIHGGRGSGKSHFAGEDLVLNMVAQHTRAVCAREVQNSIKDSSKQLLEDKIAKHGLTSRFRITDREIIYPPTDSLVIFRGLQNHTATSIKSLEGFTEFWCDEAQGLSQRSIDLAVPTFRTGSQLTFTWNPLKASDPVEKLFRGNEDDPDFCLVEAQYYDNPWFPEELRRDMERDKRRDPDKYAHIWLGKYQRASEARVFHNWSVQEFETPQNARFYLGADWGFSIDPTVLIRCFIVGDKLYIDRECYKVGLEIDNTPAFFDLLDPSNPKMAREWPMTADSARPETISYMKRHGYTRIKPSIKGQGSVEDGIEFMKNFDIVIHPRCVHTADEFATYQWKVDPKTGEILPVLDDKKNHVIDAARYALESTRRSNYTLSAVG